MCLNGISTSLAQKGPKPVGRHAKAAPTVEEKWLHSHMRLAADLERGGTL